MNLLFNSSKYTANVVFWLFFSSVFLNSCKTKTEIDEKAVDKINYVAEKNEVTIAVLKNGIFKKELISNGKIVAIRKSKLQFEISDRLENLYVKNGDFVQSGQVLATLNTQKYQQKVEKAEINFKNAKIQFDDMLAGRGIFVTDKDSIAKDVYDMAASKSGYNAAALELKIANFELISTKLIAPFSGKAANIESKQFENVSAGKDFMTIIDDSVLEVEFYIIEAEMEDVALNSNVQIVPFILDRSYNGHISSINPVIEKNGTILIKAFVQNDGKLVEGMNVKVSIMKEIENQFVIPKSTIVLRDNQEVLFKVDSGKAYWTYVKTILENSTSYSVIPDPDKSSATLKEGDTVIVTGNLNLAHGSEIKVSE